MSKHEGVGEFAIGFANAAVKLRKAVDAGEGVTFDVSEAKALLDAFKALREPRTKAAAREER